MEDSLLETKKIWDNLVAEGKVPFEKESFETRTLDPEDGRLPFLLVLNEGRSRYLRNLSKAPQENLCSFCSEETLDFKIIGLRSMRVIPYEYPCLPYQFIFASKDHLIEIKREFIRDMIIFSQQTGLKLYYHKPKDSSLLTIHFHIRAALASDTNFLEWVTAEPIISNSNVLIEKLNHTVYGLRLSGNKDKIAAIIYSIFRADEYPISLVFWTDYVYLFPRSEKLIPTDFGEWLFGALEVIGTFICRDRETFQTLTYARLAEAMVDVSLHDKKRQKKIELQLKTFLERD
ncbi:MAG: hypothetical protein ACE5OZ_25015 [Candidatus Heimdallarchaeota archaeon]